MNEVHRLIAARSLDWLVPRIASVHRYHNLRLFESDGTINDDVWRMFTVCVVKVLMVCSREVCGSRERRNLMGNLEF